MSTVIIPSIPSYYDGRAAFAPKEVGFDPRQAKRAKEEGRDYTPLLPIHINTLQRWITDGQIRVIRMGRKVLIPRAEIERILREGI